MNDPERNFDFLRVSLETHLKMPSVITVTSALRNDGSSKVAMGLAEAFAAAGNATLLVSTEAQPASVSRHVETRNGLTRATSEQLTTGLLGGRAALPRAFASLRESYAIVVVDAETVPQSSFALELAREADAVLVAIRMGRRGCRTDRDTKRLLDDCGANVVGIVPTLAGARANAEARDSLRVPAIEVSQVGS